jgi:hypothetical protein
MMKLVGENNQTVGRTHLWVKIEMNHFCTKEKMKKRSVCLFVVCRKVWKWGGE